MGIYADNAATTRMSRRAIDAMLPYLEENYGNPSSLYRIGQAAAEAVADARQRIARCLGAAPEEILFTSGGSEADNQAILTAAALGEAKNKRHIVSTAFEHHAVLHTLDALREKGFEITLLDVHENGIVTPEQVKEAIREDTCLVTVMYANNEIGTVQPVREIGAVCRASGVLFHTDAVQAVGHLPVNVRVDHIDMLSLSAHKFHGPKGVGVLYAKGTIPLRSLIRGGGQENGKRAGTENVPGIMAMAEALEEACENMEKNIRHLTALRERLIAGLEQIPHAQLNGDRARRLPGTVHFCFEGIKEEALILRLDDRGIAASSGSACSSGALNSSHVLLAIGRPREIAHGSLRLSLAEDITRAEIDELVTAVGEVVEELRAISPIYQERLAGEKEFILK